MPLKLIEEEIPVKGREPERLVVRETHHGPIVNAALGADDHEPLALSWAALAFPRASAPRASASWTPSAARSSSTCWPTRPCRSRTWSGPTGSGSIGYKTMGRLPMRQGDCPDLPKPGWTGEYEWDGWVPYEELPELTDPDAGYVVTANNRITPEDFPHHISTDYLDGYRAQRISELIEAGDEHDLEGFAAMQMDLHSIPGVETARRLVRLHRPRPARDRGDRAPAQLGRPAWTPTRSRRRSTRRSPCASRARWPAPRSATATSPSAGWTAPTTGSSRTSPRRGAGSRTCWRCGRRATRS